ncbi:MAG: porphobilinogen synthase [Thermodesulfobacteriota bacterium]|nr:MAG: porphobilinogen synthase [Thermodesulfobacteriota bacterium]
MSYLLHRPRRLRGSEVLRRMVRETILTPDDLILPLFVTYGKRVKRPIKSMPGHFQLSVDNIKKEAKAVAKLGIPAVILFGIPERKDPEGSSAFDPKGPVQAAIKAIKNAAPGLLVITDVCMCEYTSHGHCGIIKGGDVDNDETLDLLAREALSHAQAGADIVAPSDMMDGRVGAIRDILDDNGYEKLPIMSYAAKYSSAFYGPFREAAGSTPAFGDRRTYQMDPANTDEAIREVALDLEEGADIVMVKPALPYLDIIRRVKEQFGFPTAAYNVSGEFSMIKAAAEKGWLDGDRAMMESLTSIKRAGADMILTYFAKEAAELLNK